MLNLHSAGLLYLKFDYALKYKKKLTLLNSLLSVGVFGLDFFFRSKRYRALSLVFLSGGEVVNVRTITASTPILSEASMVEPSFYSKCAFTLP